MIIVAIETSCDETAVAIVKFSRNRAEVLSNIISSQVKAHSKYGGVVPSLASRMHLKNMVPVLKRAFKQAEKHKTGRGKRGIHFDKNKIDYVAVTNGPGLIPALMIGVNTAKSLSYALNKPLVGIHHIEGHIYANWLKKNLESGIWNLENKKQKVKNEKLKMQKLEDSKFQNYDLWKPEFPILCLTVSGGHTQLILMKKDLNYKIIGETMDDAAGEAFDKIAKLLNLGYPGGPLVEKMAKKGDRNKFKFTRPMINSKDYNFSFSGLKTAVLYEVRSRQTFSHLDSCLPDRQALPEGERVNSKFSARGGPALGWQILRPRRTSLGLANSKFKSDIAASFQQAVIDVLVFKTIKAAKQYKAKNIILGGGVSANRELQKQFKKAINKELPNTEYQILNTNLSTDNAFMIAIAAYYRIKNDKGIGNWKNIKADANLKIES
ncbi:tRNA (adenosine(37)-N6)-threonylcarbamoyltransferase complex transferase subunit TsaD [Candidatus Parcubacteria bacterium]|nr:tRNA (adenosine(37)-N6)-threonylcarbamoyltransferase complex transferase subunit TsaD [Candidatus Parcubacteria bacterium]